MCHFPMTGESTGEGEDGRKGSPEAPEVEGEQPHARDPHLETLSQHLCR